jgi:hypothetical protein
MPVLGPRPAYFSYHMMRIYRRFKKIALARRAAGEAGKRNNGPGPAQTPLLPEPGDTTV